MWRPVVEQPLRPGALVGLCEGGRVEILARGGWFDWLRWWWSSMAWVYFLRKVKCRECGVDKDPKGANGYW